MSIEKEVDKIVSELRKSNRVGTLHTYIPKPDDDYKFYACISGFLDDDYFDFCVRRPVEEHHASENGISSTTDQKIKFKMYLKKISNLKFTTQS